MKDFRHFRDFKADAKKEFKGNFHRVFFWMVIGVVLAVLFALVFGFVVKWLWAATLTPIFNVSEITYWQAVGIVILARLIFGGFGGHRNKSDRSRREYREGPPRFFQKMHDRFHGMADRTEADDDVIDMNGDIPEKDRQYYQKFWDKEGRNAFERFVSRMRDEDEGPDSSRDR